MGQEKKTNWTENQQQAIDLRSKNILVSAAAGSGKTAVLVERIKELMVKDGVGIDEMLIVTFTNAAAAEMKERLSDALSEEIEKSKGDDAFLRQQLNKLNSANISTFHGFCMEVIRRYFYLIDVEPTFKICDEIQKTIFAQEAVTLVVENRFEENSFRAADMMEAYGSVGSEDAVKKMILAIHDFIQSIPAPFEWLLEKIEELRQTPEEFMQSKTYETLRTIIEEALEKALQCFRGALDVLEDEGLPKMQLLGKRDVQTVNDLMEAFRLQDFETFTSMASNVKFATFTAPKEEKEAFEMVKETVKAIRDAGKKAINGLKEKYFDGTLKQQVDCVNETYERGLFLYELVAEFDEIYKFKKSEKGLLDFSDIEHYALNILRNEAPAKEYREQFSYIFIDEYQDSNVVQETLIDRIKRENNVFMVGDVKQSIYKFRLAEPDLFIQKYNRYRKQQEQSSVKIDLNKNFRSKGNVIHLTNCVFEQVMNEKSCGMDYDEDARLYQGVEYEGNLDYPCELHIIDERAVEEEIDQEILEMKKAELEASIAATLVKENIGKPLCQIKKDKTKIQRGTTYRDMVILLRSYKSYSEIFAEIFAKEGIPLHTNSGESYFETIEIGVFINLLKVVDNKKQDIPLLSMLRSPIFKITPDELAMIRLNHPKGAYYEAFEAFAKEEAQEEGEASKGEPETDVLREKCKAIMQTLKKWKRESQYMELGEFLNQLAMQTGYYDYLGALNYGAQRQANIRKLIDRAAAFQTTSMKGLFGFISYIEQMQKTGVGPSQMQILGENDDVVRLMSVHKSKGLEFPMVIVGGLGKRFNHTKESGSLALHKDLGIGLRMVDTQNGYYVKTIKQKVIDGLKIKEENAEEMRILYVAMTRAQDKLMLLGSVKKDVESLLMIPKDPRDANCFLDWILPVMHQGGRENQKNWSLHLYNRGDISVEKTQKKENLKEKLKMFDHGFLMDESQSDEIQREIEKKFAYQYPHLKATNIQSKFTVSELSSLGNGRNEGGEGNEGGVKQTQMPELIGSLASMQSKKSFTAPEKGTIMHKLLQLIHLKEIQTIEDVKRQADQLVEKELLTAEEVAAIDLRKIFEFASSKMGQRIKRSEKIWREQAFTLVKKGADLLPDIEDPRVEIIIQGMIDCYFEEAGKLILVDYKTDRMFFSKDIGEQERSEIFRQKAMTYAKQIALYEEAIQVTSHKKVEESYICFLNYGIEIDVKSLLSLKKI